jgi:hypothetical protein
VGDFRIVRPEIPPRGSVLLLGRRQNFWYQWGGPTQGYLPLKIYSPRSKCVGETSDDGSHVVQLHLRSRRSRGGPSCSDRLTNLVQVGSTLTGATTCANLVSLQQFFGEIRAQHECIGEKINFSVHSCNVRGGPCDTDCTTKSIWVGSPMWGLPPVERVSP